MRHLLNVFLLGLSALLAGCSATEKISQTFTGDKKDPKEMAKNLFSRLRTFDELGVEKIYAEDIPLNNETLALINRLYKAAGYAFI